MRSLAPPPIMSFRRFVSDTCFRIFRLLFEEATINSTPTNLELQMHAVGELYNICCSQSPIITRPVSLQISGNINWYRLRQDLCIFASLVLITYQSLCHAFGRFR